MILKIQITSGANKEINETEKGRGKSKSGRAMNEQDNNRNKKRENVENKLIDSKRENNKKKNIIELRNSRNLRYIIKRPTRVKPLSLSTLFIMRS